MRDPTTRAGLLLINLTLHGHSRGLFSRSFHLPSLVQLISCFTSWRKLGSPDSSQRMNSCEGSQRPMKFRKQLLHYCVKKQTLTVQDSPFAFQRTFERDLFRRDRSNDVARKHWAVPICSKPRLTGMA